MCRWLAYQGSPIYLEQLVYQPEHSLVHQSLEARKAVTRVNADGFGLGWYTERSTPGRFHEVLPHWEMRIYAHWLTIFAHIALWLTFVHRRARKYRVQTVIPSCITTGCFCITAKLVTIVR